RLSSARGFAPPETRRSDTESGASPISTRSGRRRSGNERDTIDLLQRGLAAPRRVERGVAQEARAARLSRLLGLAHRGAPGNQLADLVVEDHQLCDRLAPLVPGAAARAASPPDAETEGARLLGREPGFLEQSFPGAVVLGA